MCAVRVPSVPERDRDGEPILSYPILSKPVIIPAANLVLGGGNWETKAMYVTGSDINGYF